MENTEGHRRPSDSLVVVFTGGRGAGKTLSMVFSCCQDLVRGRQVFSNIPIAFRYQGRVYRSAPLDMEALYVLDSGVRNCVVAIDEINLWADSWSTQAVSSKMLVVLFQQIRKRNLSFYLTVQSFAWLNNRIRWQTDLHVSCRDYSFGKQDIERGCLIAQNLRDMSGIFTGRPWTPDSYYSQNRNEVDRLFVTGKVFWPMYNSYHEFELSDMSTKYVFRKETKIISNGEMSDMDSPGEMYGKVCFMLDSLRAEGKTELGVGQMQEYLQYYGINSGLKNAGKFFKDCGVEFKRSRKGNYYKIVDEFGQQT